MSNNSKVVGSKYYYINYFKRCNHFMYGVVKVNYGYACFSTILLKTLNVFRKYLLEKQKFKYHYVEKSNLL